MKATILNLNSIIFFASCTKEQPNLIFKEGYFHNVEDRNPFKQKQVTVVAPRAENNFDSS
jgi:hypothetical protein